MSTPRSGEGTQSKGDSPVSRSAGFRLARPLVVFDLETTGLDVQKDRIVEIALLTIHPDGRRQTWARRINPGMPIPPEATRIHGIRDEDVAGAPRFAEVAAELHALFEGADVAGYNIDRYDLPLLAAEFGRAGIPFAAGGRAVVDAATVFHKMNPRTLSAAFRHYTGRDLEGAHSAEADVEACAEVLQAQLARHDELPRDAAALDAWCHAGQAERMDWTGKFVRVEGEATFAFGKHQGRRLRQIAATEPDYLDWILRQDGFPGDARAIVSAARRGESRVADAPAGARAAADPLAAWRGEFPILDRTCYMVSHSLGAMPRGVEGEMRAFAETWATRGVRAWREGWWEMPVEVGNLLAPILGAPAGTVTMHPNASAAAAVVCSALSWDPPRNRIVHTALDFPSLMYVFGALEKRGARRTIVPSGDGITIDEERVIEAIDETTALVSISHVLFQSSALLDVRPIIAKAHAVGARVLLDSYHAVGVLPVDVTALDVDFVVGGSVKWLCGGPGAGYLYANPSRADTFEPWVTGWTAHERPFAFEPEMRYAHGPFRWLGGTPQVPCCYMARPGYATVRRVGVEVIRAKSQRLTQRLIERADEEGWDVRSPRDPDRRGGAVCLRVPHAEAVAAELIRRELIVDARPEAGVRVGPHFYNTEEEVERVAREMKEILSTRAYERHLGKPPAGGASPGTGRRP